MIKKQKKQKIYEIYETQTRLRQLTKSELEKICYRMNCPKGTKNEMITSLLKPLQIYHASRHQTGGYRMNCPKGTKNEMITSLLKPLQI